MKWYVVQALSAQEKRVKKGIEEALDRQNAREWVEEILIPSENVSEIKNGQQRVVERKLWPGYLLIKMLMSDEAWQVVKETPGVIDFLGGDRPQALSDAEVAEILRDLEDKKQKVTQKHKFAIGDAVKITDGVFVNFIGTVTEVSHEKGRLSVVVSIFGRDTRVDDLEFSQVEEMTEEVEG